MEIAVQYKGQTLTTFSSGSKTFHTTDKYCEDNFTIAISIVKGDLITMNLDGTSRTYRVLSVSGTKAKCMAMFDATSTTFGTSQVYESTDTTSLDYYMENTWYANLVNGKDAIDLVTIQQDSWYMGLSGNPDYRGIYYETSTSSAGQYNVSLDKTDFGNQIQRHVYAISVQDVLDYLETTPEMTYSNTTLTYGNICTMFWNDTTVSSERIWLSSADGSVSGRAWYVIGGAGLMNVQYSNQTAIARPAFTIDLSQVSWSITSNTTSKTSNTTSDSDDDSDVN